jgi:hypothetical protein
MTSLEISQFLSRLIKNNSAIQEKGGIPTAINIEGHAGLGKTSCVMQVANKLNLNLIKLNLAQMEELGDLVGYPQRESKLSDGSWVPCDVIDRLTLGDLTVTSETRMSYAKPHWLEASDPNKSGGILLLDDWTRGDPRFTQAVMELIDRQEYISWKLPPGWTIVLTSNPTDDQYIVQEIDNAQRTRFLQVKYAFDVRSWAEWASDQNLDSRCIAFVLRHHAEIFKPSGVNPRQMGQFFSQIGLFESFSERGALGYIRTVGNASIGPEATSLFLAFVDGDLAKLPDPKLLWKKEAEEIVREMNAAVYGGNSQPNTALMALLSSHFAYFLRSNYGVNSKATFTANDVNKIVSIMKSNVLLQDVALDFIKKLQGVQKMEILFRNADISRYIMETR